MKRHTRGKRSSTWRRPSLLASFLHASSSFLLAVSRPFTSGEIAQATVVGLALIMAQNGYNNGYPNGYGYDQQPGLELAPDGYKSVPQVAMAETSPMPQYIIPGSPEDPNFNYAVKPYTYPEPVAPQDIPPSPQKPRRKLLWWVVGGVVVLLAIIGGIVGGLYGSGVLGQSAGGSSEENSDGSSSSQTPGASSTPTDPESSGEATTEPSSTSSTPSTTAPLETSIPTAYGIEQSIRRGSALAAASWMTPEGDTEVYLFTQDADNGIRYSRFDSGGEPVLNDTQWEDPVMVLTAEEYSRFAATLVIYGDTHEPQIQLYYSTTNERLLGMKINQHDDPAISEDIVNGGNWNATQGGAVAAYWPWVNFLNEDNVIMESRNTIGGRLQPNTVDFDTGKRGIRTQPGSGIAMVPMHTDFRGVAHDGGYGLIYRDLEGYLVAEHRMLGTPAEDFPISWPADFPSIKIAEDAPIAAFSYARSSSDGAVNTFILYRDGSEIRTVSTDGSSWVQARPQVFRGVDLDTQIACISMGTSGFDSSESRINLARGVSGNKCYFQKKGSVREVVIESGEWVEVGIVPIP